MYFVNPILSILILSTNPLAHFISFSGLVNLSIQSYVWHSKCEEYIKDKSLNIVSDELVWYFLKDNVAIQIAGYTASIAAYYHSEWFYAYLLISTLYHTIPIYIQYNMTMRMKKEGEIVNEKSSSFLLSTYALISGPIAADVIICAYNSTLYSTGFPLLCLHVFIGCLLIMTPFYQFNHIVFHLSLWVQSGLLAYSNSRQLQ
jgi:hypothetical protein